MEGTAPGARKVLKSLGHGVPLPELSQKEYTLIYHKRSKEQKEENVAAKKQNLRTAVDMVDDDRKKLYSISVSEKVNYNTLRKHHDAKMNNEIVMMGRPAMLTKANLNDLSDVLHQKDLSKDSVRKENSYNWMDEQVVQLGRNRVRLAKDYQVAIARRHY